MSLKILIRFRCSFTSVDEIYSYQSIFIVFIIIIHTVFGSKIKPIAIACFYLNLQLRNFKLLVSAGDLGAAHIVS